MDTSQRIKLFIWKCLQDALPTKMKLGAATDEEKKCVFCQHMEESTYHLFFECAYAKQVWILPPMASQGVSLNLTNAKTFLEHYNEWKIGNLDSIFMALAATKCRFIWKERCLRVFENKTRTSEQLAIAISSYFVYWHPNNRHTNHRLHSINHSRNIYWQLPPANTLKLNCDASWLSEITSAGFGFVIRNSTETFTAAEHGWCRTFSAEEEKAVALPKATQCPSIHNIQNLIIEGDNQATISYLQGKTNSVKWQCIAVLEEVKVVAAKLVSFKGFQYVDRRANKVEDLLAKEGRRSNNTSFWSDQAPSFLFPAIAFDTVKAYELCNSNDTTLVSCSAIVNPTNSVIRRATQHELVSEKSELAD
ncbi:uncharacterized protein LOC113351982 [Papaver somniferum]|uniref:uncharacterized protein LOC113351982 n=1 Tax=Papaver somniferum TaxID=3469 RepID=UPI000E6F5C4B|nr:uncharacterized protein LOC113351982 [Papaver somniferum]